MTPTEIIRRYSINVRELCAECEGVSVHTLRYHAPTGSLYIGAVVDGDRHWFVPVDGIASAIVFMREASAACYQEARKLALGEGA